jgi:hypothetical protein
MSPSKPLWVSLIAAVALAGACAKGETGDGSFEGVPDGSTQGDVPDGAAGDPADARPAFPDANNSFPDANNSFPDAQPPADAFVPIDAGPQPDGAVLGMACVEAQSQPNSDACAGAIDLTADATSGGALIYGDTTSYTNVLEPDSACTDGFGLDGPDAMYKVDATAGQTISATVTPSGSTFDVGMYILDSCATAATCLTGTDASAGTSAESVSYVVATTGTYYVIVDSWTSTAFGCYGLQVGVQ